MSDLKSKVNGDPSKFETITHDLEGVVEWLAAQGYSESSLACMCALALLLRLREQCEAKDVEIERLKKQIDLSKDNSRDVMTAVEDHIASLSAENERLKLRAALSAGLAKWAEGE